MRGATPLYSLVQKHLRRMIEEGRLKPGQALPSEADLCKEHGVSRITVRRALDDLAASGIVKRRRGVGTFVSEKPSKSVQLTATLETVLAPAPALKQKLLAAVDVPAPAIVASALRLEDDASVRMLEMLHSGREGPFCLSRTYVTTLAGDALDEKQLVIGRPAMHIADAAYGTVIRRAEQAIDVDIARKAIAAHLELKPQTPLLRVTRTYFVGDDTPIAFAISWYHPERFRYTVQLLGTLQSAG